MGVETNITFQSLVKTNTTFQSLVKTKKLKLMDS